MTVRSNTHWGKRAAVLAALLAVLVAAPALAQSIVGAWFLGDASVPDRSAALVFLPNDVYYFAQDGDPVADPSGIDGIEIGTYAWDPTSGVLVSSRAGATDVDTNTSWGLSNAGVMMARVSADSLTATFTTSSGTTMLVRLSPARSGRRVDRRKGFDHSDTNSTGLSMLVLTCN